MTKHEQTLLQYRAGYDSAEPSRKAFLRNCCKAGLRIWPTSKHNRRGWLAQTIELFDRGDHLKLTGKWAERA